SPNRGRLQAYRAARGNPAAMQAALPPPVSKERRPPFVAVVGLHSSGSSCLAGVLHHLGVHMGNTFTRSKFNGIGYEAVSLAKLCERAVPFPRVGLVRPAEETREALRRFIEIKQREAA